MRTDVLEEFVLAARLGRPEPLDLSGFLVRLPRDKEAERYRAKKHYWRIRSDPDRWEQHKAKHREEARRAWQDPEKRARRQAQNRALYERLKADPIRYAEFLKKGAERKRRQRAKR